MTIDIDETKVKRDVTIINTGSTRLKLYTLFAPPNHRDGVVHHARAEAESVSHAYTWVTITPVMFSRGRFQAWLSPRASSGCSRL